MYSSMPTRKRRVEMIGAIARTLRPGGRLICQFLKQDHPNPRRGDRLRKFIASCGLGNRFFESGDSLWLNVEFIHYFHSEQALRSEIEEGGLFIEHLHMDFPGNRGGAVCRKSIEQTIRNKEEEIR